MAITGYDIALTLFTQQGFPYEWARTQNNLGLAYSNRIRGEKAENLEQAIQFYQAALTEYTQQGFPYEWASQELQQLGQTIEEEKRRLEATKNLEPTYLNQLRQQRQQIIGQLIPLQPIPFAEIQGLVDDHTAIVQWYIFNDCFRAFIITRNSQELPIWESSRQDLQDLEEWSYEYLLDYGTDKDKWRHQLASCVNLSAFIRVHLRFLTKFNLTIVIKD
ncbi:MAG: tetratricopeptide repeat protein [Stigonema ocellatum SAG 48.90 = DSM 106950]|nr:tetratricopeptide repeat protein [Stigonema ocellatum SAG 48.90 = DSM 106950]